MRGLNPGKDMDEAIAVMVLNQVENGLDISTPVATMVPQVDACEECGKAFARADQSA